MGIKTSLLYQTGPNLNILWWVNAPVKYCICMLPPKAIEDGLQFTFVLGFFVVVFVVVGFFFGMMTITFVTILLL